MVSSTERLGLPAMPPIQQDLTDRCDDPAFEWIVGQVSAGKPAAVVVTYKQLGNAVRETQVVVIQDIEAAREYLRSNPSRPGIPHMESGLLSSLGRIAGLGGIVVGVLFLIFRSVLEKKFLDVGLAPGQAFAVVMSILIFTFGMAGVGIIAWLVSRATGPNAPVTAFTMTLLAGLIVVVLGSAVYMAAQAAGAPQQSKPSAAPSSS